MAMNRPAASSRHNAPSRLLHMFLLVALALTARLVLLPYASQDTDDHSLRVWIAWRWGEDPFFFLHGHWPPLHFFLLGPVIHWFHDPLLAPVLLQVAFGSLVPAVLYLFTVREWGDRRAALAVGAAFALYPVAIRTSLEVLAQPPFSLCLALAFLALSHARAPSATWRQAAVAGVALSLAGLFRVEGWVLIPFFALTLWPRLPLVVVCGAVGAIAPALIMLANLLHYGDLFYSITTVTDFELHMAGRENFTLLQHAGQVVRYAGLVVGGMTPVLALFCVLGALSSLLRRERQAIWLLPAVAMGLILAASVARGTTGPKQIYTEVLGLLLIPFLASFLLAPDLRRLPKAATAGAYAVLFGSMLFLLVLGTLRDIPGMRERYRLVAAIPALNAAPNFPDKASVDQFLPAIRAGDGNRQGLIIDTLGSPANSYLGLHSLYHPNRVFLTPNAPNADLDAQVSEDLRSLRTRWQPLQDSEPLDFDAFLRAYCSGFLVLQPGSRFAGWLGYREPDRASRHGIELRLDAVARAPWPMPTDARLRAAGVAETAAGEVVLFRYTIANCAAGG